MSNTYTPETYRVWSETLRWCHARDEYHDPQHAALANLCAKLERERNEAREAVRAAKILLTYATQWHRSKNQDAAVERWEKAAAKIPENASMTDR